MSLEERLRNLPPRMNFGTAPSINYQPSSQVHLPQSTYASHLVQQPFTLSAPHNSKIPRIHDTSKVIKLKDCDPKEIIYITKNRVVGESIIKVPVVSKPVQRHNLKRIQKIQEKTKDQFKENQDLFNYQRQVKERNDRKQKFLQDMEKKINEAQKEAKQLQQQFREQEGQLKEIEQLQGRINQQFHNQRVNQQVSKLQQQIQENEDKKKIKKIELGMEIDEIKKVIQNEQQLDQRIIDEADDIINRIRGTKSKKQAVILNTKQKVSRPSQKIAAPATSSFNTTKKRN